MAKRIIIGTLLITLLLVGCGSSGGGSDTGGSDGDSKTTADAGGDTDDPGDDTAEPGSCGSFEEGKDGVVRTFCDGTASVTLTIDGTEYELTGGECETSGGLFSINIGVVTGLDFTGDPPDYFGATLQEATGDQTEGATVTWAVDGAADSMLSNGATASHDGSSGTFAGTTLDGDKPVSGSFTC